MPKKKRNQRVREETYAGSRASGRSLYSNVASSPSTLPDSVIRNNFAIGEDVDPAECLKYLQEMFHGKLDPDVIHMVLTECEFNVNVALEGLFTLLNESSEGLLSSTPSRSKLSSSSSSESIVTENIVTSEAEVHKSSEERESLLGMAAERTASWQDTQLQKSKPSPPSMADFVDAPPFVPSMNYTTPLLYSQAPASSDIVQRARCSTPQTERKISSPKTPFQEEQQKLRTLVANGEKVLVLMRGLPGSGKTTLAEQIKGSGVILSTDHFFYHRDVYRFDKTRLPEAHEWNKCRVKEAIEDGRTPIIVDNTNIEAWEMMPYVAIALRGKYQVIVLEPDTPWKFNVRQLARRNIHGVQSRSLQAMLERYEGNLTAESLCKHLGFSPQSAECEEGETPASDDMPKDLNKATEGADESGNSKGEVTPAMEETISLHDLMVLVQNDSEESSNRSRQSSGSWSSEQECNDWEEVTDDDFLWKSTTKNAGLRKHSVQGAIETVREEPELSDTQVEIDCRDAENELCAHLDEGLKALGCEIHESEALEEEVPKLQRPAEKFCAIAKSQHPSETDVSFSEPWGPQDEGGRDEAPKPQRESPKKRSSPEQKGEQTTVLVTKSLENLTLPSLNLSGEAKGSKSLESISNLSSKILIQSGQHNVRNKRFGLQRAVENCSWRIPEFSLQQFKKSELLEVYEKKDVSTTTDDWLLVHKVLAGKSSDLPIIIPIVISKTTTITDFHSMPMYRSNARDQSTSTMAIPTPELDPLERLELLQQCVPEASKPDLEDIFQQCHGDHIWAADILLESGTIGDLKPLVIREDAEESSSTIAFSQVKNDSQFQQQAHRKQSDNVYRHSSSRPILCGDYDGEYSGGETYYRFEAANYYNVDGPYESMANGHDLEGSDNDPPFSLTLTPAFASQLVEVFGSDGLHVSTDAFSSEDLTVVVGHSLAKEVHRAWMETLRRTLNREDQEMDEMAQENRPPQSQEEPRGASSNESVSYAPDNDFPVPPAPQWSKPPHEMSFKEIMEMEAELENRRKERIKKADMDMATKLKNQKLYDKFPGIDRQALDEIFAANNYSLLQSVSTINETLGIDPSESAEHQETVAELVMAESRLQQEEEDMAWCPTVEGHEHMYERLQIFGDYDALRREATVHYHLRQESFQKAKGAYHRGMKTVAAFYSQQGRLHAEKMRAANERASGILFDLRNASCDDNTLDLHGLHVQEAIQVLKNFVKLKKREAWCLQKKVVLRVITGRGAHSSHNIPKVKCAVEGYLRSSQLSYDEVQAGMFHIKL